MGDIFLKTGSPETYGNNRNEGRILENYSAKYFKHNLDDYSGYPKKFYGRYQSDAGGWAWVGPITVNKTVDIPSVPSTPNATSQGTTKNYISWGSVSGATLYRLYRATSANGSYQQIYYASGTSYTDTGTHLTPNTTYFYKVKAGNDGGWSKGAT